MTGLDHRNAQAHAGQPDQIDVRVITHPDGSTSRMLYVPAAKPVKA